MGALRLPSNRLRFGSFDRANFSRQLFHLSLDLSSQQHFIWISLANCRTGQYGDWVRRHQQRHERSGFDHNRRRHLRRHRRTGHNGGRLFGLEETLQTRQGQLSERRRRTQIFIHVVRVGADHPRSATASGFRERNALLARHLSHLQVFFWEFFK